ncbi:hypothetical protein KVF89_19055 [Nocardioides carbamazepini]|uniref:hypothetical protein n=1 Tax=Nocardioides carbamazepini TaxID=2854259 RepID=UPI002149B710|nr:hypothetical protein [Nocardioides carbamazepini]MCR1784650.1 hypothetical protein [Nocardioides carbamazepini]
MSLNKDDSDSSAFKDIDARGVTGQRCHIGIGRTHAGTHVRLLIQDLNVQVIHATTGEILRELEIDLNRDYQPTGRPPGPTKKQ